MEKTYDQGFTVTMALDTALMCSEPGVDASARVAYAIFRKRIKLSAGATMGAMVEMLAGCGIDRSELEGYTVARLGELVAWVAAGDIREAAQARLEAARLRVACREAAQV